MLSSHDQKAAGNDQGRPAERGKQKQRHADKNIRASVLTRMIKAGWVVESSVPIAPTLGNGLVKAPILTRKGAEKLCQLCAIVNELEQGTSPMSPEEAKALIDNTKIWGGVAFPTAEK